MGNSENTHAISYIDNNNHRNEIVYNEDCITKIRGENVQVSLTGLTNMLIIIVIKSHLCIYGWRMYVIRRWKIFEYSSRRWGALTCHHHRHHHHHYCYSHRIKLTNNLTLLRKCYSPCRLDIKYCKIDIKLPIGRMGAGSVCVCVLAWISVNWLPTHCLVFSYLRFTNIAIYARKKWNISVILISLKSCVGW